MLNTMTTNDALLTLATQGRPFSADEKRLLHEEMCSRSHDIRSCSSAVRTRRLRDLRALHAALARCADMTTDEAVVAVGDLLDQYKVPPAPPPWPVEVEAAKPTGKRLAALQQKLADACYRAGDEAFRASLAPAIEIAKEQLRPEIEKRRHLIAAVNAQHAARAESEAAAAELGMSPGEIAAMFAPGPTSVDVSGGTPSPAGRDLRRAPRSTLLWIDLIARSELGDLEAADPAVAQVLETGKPKKGGA